MPDDIEGELAIASGMGELGYRRSPQRNAAKYERASVVGEFLLAASALLTHHADRVEFFDLGFRKTESRQYGLKGVEWQGSTAANGGGVNLDRSARSSGFGEFPSQVSTGHDCDKNVIPIVAKPGKSRKF